MDLAFIARNRLHLACSAVTTRIPRALFLLCNALQTNLKSKVDVVELLNTSLKAQLLYQV